MANDSVGAGVDDSSDVVVGKGNVQQVVNVNTGETIGERLARLEERLEYDSDMPPANDSSPYALIRLEAKIDRILERQDTIIAEQADFRRRISSVESIAQGLQKQSPTIDRIMVTLLALAMLAMLAFNVVAVYR